MASLEQHHQKSHADEDEILLEESKSTTNDGESPNSIFLELRDVPDDEHNDNTNEEIDLHFSNIRYINLLREYQDTTDSSSAASIHKKQSKEKNGVNPDELPEVWKAPPAPTPTELVQRAPDSPTMRPSLGGRVNCRVIDGKFGDDRQSAKNGGVVLRYQYEVTQDLDGYGSIINERGERDGSDYLKSEVLPGLEGAIGDWLLPVFFGDECLKIRIESDSDEEGAGDEEGSGIAAVEEVVGGRRRLMDHESLRHRRLENKVVGLDVAPVDFPLAQGACISDYASQVPLQTTQCHKIEGALTLFFPPNYSYSTLLSAATLTTLRAIQDGMESGKLAKLGHPAILYLLFLESSYSLKPILPGSGDKAVPMSVEKGGSGGLVAGIVIPLLLVLCCAGGFFVRKRRMAKNKEEEEAIEEEEDVYVSPKTWVANGGNHHEDDGDNGTTTSDDDNQSTTSGSSSTEGSTTSGSKEYTTTDSDNDDGTSSYSSQDSEEIYVDDDQFDSELDLNYDRRNSSGSNNNPYNKKKTLNKRGRQQKRKKPNTNIVIGGGDEMSVATGATGATGMHSVASERTVKMKNIVLPNIDINMR
eukprot:g12971.t1 g12971   contig7:574704-576584(-)